MIRRIAVVLIALGAAFWAAPGARAQSNAYWFYVTAESADEVYLIRFADGKAEVAEKIDVGYQPTEIEGPHGLTVSPDGEHWYLTMAHGKPFGILYKYSTATNRVVGECELGLFPATMQISKSTGLLYCVNFDLHGDMSPSTVSIVDPEEMGEVARVTTGPMPHGSRLSPDGRFHYSCAMMSGELFEIDAAEMRLTRVLDLDANVPRMVAPHMSHDPAEHEHAEHEGHDDHGADAHAEHGQAKEHQGHGAEHEGHVGQDEHAGHEGMHHAKSKPTWVYPHPTKQVVYVAMNGADQIAEVDLKTFKIVRRFETGKGPYNVEVSPDGTRLVATYKSEGAIGIWDVEGGRELARIPTTRKVSHGVVISPDSRYAFVSNEGIGGEHGTVDVFDLNTNEKVSTVEIGLQAGGIYFWKQEPIDRVGAAAMSKEKKLALLKGRAEGLWNARVAGDWEGTYKYHFPAGSVTTLLQWLQGRGSIAYHEFQIESVELTGEDTAEVTVSYRWEMVNPILTAKLKSPPVQEAQDVVHPWHFADGNWYRDVQSLADRIQQGREKRGR
ncbi:MAG: YncE family protein [Planctomycetota bacterium]